MDRATFTKANEPTTGALIRPASATDQSTITALVRAAGINPIGLHWQRFLIAAVDDRTVGIGQVKVHGDGSRELASLAVVPEWRGRGLATQIIQALLADEQSVLYLTCRPELETFYNRFGFKRVDAGPLPPYFGRIARFVRLVTWFTRRPPFVLIMSNRV